MAVEGGPDGLTDPGPLPTTLTRVIQGPTDRAMLSAARHRIERMRTGLIAARELAKMVTQLPDHYLGDFGENHERLTGLIEAARYWTEQHGALADPPLVVEVEEDDDDETPEGEYEVREHATEVRLVVGGMMTGVVGTIDDPAELPRLLHEVGDWAARGLPT